MRYSKSFIKTFKEAPREAENISTALLLRGGFIDKEASGIYSFLPMGWRVTQKISQIIREEMNNLGGQEILMPSMQPKELWLETERWDKMEPPLFKVKDRHEKEFALASTHEEAIVDLMRDRISSFRELPFMLYQIQEKFRNELRFTGGLLRTREFLMKDAYSFHADQKDFDDFYKKVIAAYEKIFERCGLKIKLVEAHSGSIGGKKSNEFMVLSEAGEDRIFLCGACDWAANAELVKDFRSCPACGGEIKEARAIEVGHVFALGDLYSKKMKATFTDRDGKEKNFIMGCYGIGIGRLLSAAVEENHDNKGIIWPAEIAPARVYLIDLEGSQGEKIYDTLSKSGIEVLFDDREVSAGVKFSDADLLGLPYRIVISEKTLKENKVELKKRDSKESTLIDIDKVSQELNNEKK